MSRRLRHRELRPKKAESDHWSGPGSGAGNRSLVAAMNGRGFGGAAEIDMGGQPDPTSISQLLAEINGSNLGLAQTLEGHGGGLDADPSGVAPTPATAPSPDAIVRFTANAPSEIRKPEVDISADHGRPNVAGWTTPSYAVAVPSVSSNRASINVTLDFAIELASEYSGVQLEVLKDHEMGHVQIGTNVAKTDLVADLETSLESLPTFAVSSLQAVLASAATNFVTNEAYESTAFDGADYPRMREAYLGAKSTIEELSTGSEGIATLAAAMRGFVSYEATAMSLGELRAAAAGIDGAWSALSDVEAARVQYNKDFKQLVADCEAHIATLRVACQTDGLNETSAGEEVAVRGTLKTLHEVLSRFQWQPSI